VLAAGLRSARCWTCAGGVWPVLGPAVSQRHRQVFGWWAVLVATVRSQCEPRWCGFMHFVWRYVHDVDWYLELKVVSGCEGYAGCVGDAFCERRAHVTVEWGVGVAHVLEQEAAAGTGDG